MTKREKQIKLLKTSVAKWNRYVLFCRKINIDFYADLSSADLRSADLSYADLSSADLSYADLSYANLRYANLRYADLSYANLRDAHLCDANLDFSCLGLSCKTLKMKTDIKIRRQISYHLCAMFEWSETLTKEEKIVFESLKEYANKFHRVGELKKFKTK